MLKETEQEAKRRRLRGLRDALCAFPPETVGVAYKNILSEMQGNPVSEKTEAVIRAENIILKTILEMEI